MHKSADELGVDRVKRNHLSEEHHRQQQQQQQHQIQHQQHQQRSKRDLFMEGKHLAAEIFNTLTIR